MSYRFSAPGIALGFCLLTLVSAAGLAGPQSSIPPAPTVDVETVGPKLGDALPEFNLRDQSGHLQSLKSLFGSNGAIIVFFRSADW
jgi:hypothetical protein